MKALGYATHKGSSGKEFSCAPVVVLKNEDTFVARKGFHLAVGKTVRQARARAREIWRNA